MVQDLYNPNPLEPISSQYQKKQNKTKNRIKTKQRTQGGNGQCVPERHRRKTERNKIQLFLSIKKNKWDK